MLTKCHCHCLGQCPVKKNKNSLSCFDQCLVEHNDHKTHHRKLTISTLFLVQVFWLDRNSLLIDPGCCCSKCWGSILGVSPNVPSRMQEINVEQVTIKTMQQQNLDTKDPQICCNFIHKKSTRDTARLPKSSIAKAMTKNQSSQQVERHSKKQIRNHDMHQMSAKTQSATEANLHFSSQSCHIRFSSCLSTHTCPRTSPVSELILRFRVSPEFRKICSASLAGHPNRGDPSACHKYTKFFGF